MKWSIRELSVFKECARLGLVIFAGSLLFFNYFLIPLWILYVIQIFLCLLQISIGQQIALHWVL